MGIAQTFNDPNLRERVRTDSVLCVVDAEQIFTAPETMQLKLFQMACADIIILNKVDLVGRPHLDTITRWLDDRFDRYRLIGPATVFARVLLSVSRFAPVGRKHRLLVGANGFSDPHCTHEHHGHDHSQMFSTWSYETDRPLSLEALREAASKLPANVYRAKGVIYASDAPERRAVLQVVGRRVDISLADAWGSRTPRTQIVAIGATGSVDGALLRELFDTTAVPNQVLQ
jgi:G3E family GTPase